MKPTIFVALAALILSPVMAGNGDSFAIDWSTIDGGGGSSSSSSPGGEFSVRGTIGQPDAATSNGGEFSLQGGFWGLYGVIQTPGTPLLTIERLLSGDLRVAWPLPATGWVLDESATLGQPPNLWTLVPEVNYQADATHRFVIITNHTGNHFYGLRLP
jgi:hypothetical protein